MNKIELLPKDIYFNDDLYQLNMWVTAFGHLCIGYRLALNSKHDSRCNNWLFKIFDFEWCWLQGEFEG